MITQAQYTETGTIRATIDGVEYFIPDDMANRHRQMLAEWEAGGNVIQPYVPPPEPVPQVVPRAQGKAALIQTGRWQDVLDFVAGIEDPTERALAEVALHDTQDWRRDSPFLNAAADAIGLTEQDKDNLFILARSIIL